MVLKPSPAGESSGSDHQTVGGGCVEPRWRLRPVQENRSFLPTFVRGRSWRDLTIRYAASWDTSIHFARVPLHATWNPSTDLPANFRKKSILSIWIYVHRWPSRFELSMMARNVFTYFMSVTAVSRRWGVSSMNYDCIFNRQIVIAHLLQYIHGYFVDERWWLHYENSFKKQYKNPNLFIKRPSSQETSSISRFYGEKFKTRLTSTMTINQQV